MNLLDLIIIIAVILGAARWTKIGLVQGLFSLFGLLTGLLVGVLIAPNAMRLFDTPTTRFLAMLLTITIIAAIFDSIFETLGHRLSQRISQNQRATQANAIAGGAVGALVTLLFAWIAAAIVVASPYQSFNSQIQNSFIISQLNRRLPAAPPLVARLNGLVQPLDFPQVFSGIPPKLAPPVSTASSATVQSAVKAAGLSTVRIQASGCGDNLQVGSGWIAAEGLVMTNAHVVAGTDKIDVVDTEGVHQARVVYYDPGADIAILRTSGLAGRPLSISSTLVPRGQEAVILGFPGGGDFNAQAAGVLRSIDATGLDIYARRSITRSIYELQGHVVRGDSGGPVVLGDGTVVGMTFAAAADGSNVGYALTSPQLIDALNTAKSRSGSVSTMSCTAD